MQLGGQSRVRGVLSATINQSLTVTENTFVYVVQPSVDREKHGRISEGHKDEIIHVEKCSDRQASSKASSCLAVANVPLMDRVRMRHSQGCGDEGDRGHAKYARSPCSS